MLLLFFGSGVGVPSIATNPTTLVANSGNQSVSVFGANTNFNLLSTTQFALAGGLGAAIISQTVTTPSAATLVINPGAAAGTLTLVDSTDSNTATTITVAQVAVSVIPATLGLVLPNTASLQAVVTNYSYETSQVTWTVTPSTAGYCSPGSTASGAPTTFYPTGSTAGSAVITATSAADTTVSASCNVTITQSTITPSQPSFIFPSYVPRDIQNAGAYGGLASIFSSFWGGWVVPQYQEQALWLQRINDDMEGASPAPGWDPIRGITMGFQDGSYGVGWQIAGRQGYLSPVPVTVAKNDFAELEEIRDSGLVLYQGPIVLYQPPLALRKGDVLVFTDGRYVVGDEITPAQVTGLTIISGAKLEQRSPADIVQTIPLF